MSKRATDLKVKLSSANSVSDIATVARRDSVQRAFDMGKTVPPEVLAEYPDLQSRASGRVQARMGADEAEPATPNVASRKPGQSETQTPSRAAGETEAGTSAQDTPRWGIYRVNVKDQGERFAVRESADPRGFGDTLHKTMDEARAYIDNAKAREESRKQQQANATEAEKKKQNEKEVHDDIDGFASDQPVMQRGKVVKTLNGLARIGGKVASIKEHVRGMVKGGADLSTREEPKIKPMSRTEFNRADQRTQDAHEKKMREAGNKTVYLVNGYDLGKTAYDYAKHLQEKTAATAPATV